MAQSMTSDQLLAQLTGENVNAVATLEKRASEQVNVETQLSDIQTKLEEAAQIKDEQQRKMRLRVLQSSLAEVRAASQREEEDLGKAVFGLNALLEQMGIEYSKLGELNQEEKALVASAEAGLAEAEAELNAAGEKWNLFGSRERAKHEATNKIALAKNSITEAKTEAARRARQRLLKANMEASLQEFMVRVDKTVAIMETRMGQINNQLTIVSARKKEAFKVREAAAAALEKFDTELNDFEATLQGEEEKLSSFMHGSPEYAGQEAKISELRRQVEDLRGRRNTAFVLHQSKDKFAEELEIHERTQMKLRDNQRMWITSLKSDTEERVVTFKSRLEAMKAMADQDIAKNLDDLGAAVDRNNAEYMATAGAASDRLRMEKIEEHPQRMREMMAIGEAQIEALQKIRVREQAAIEHFKQQYGIDPTKSSFFSYQAREAEKPESDNTRVAP